VIDPRSREIQPPLNGRWRKSRLSESNGACVEVRLSNGSVQIRDSKDAEGPILHFSPRCWREFVESLTGTDTRS